MSVIPLRRLEQVRDAPDEKQTCGKLSIFGDVWQLMGDCLLPHSLPVEALLSFCTGSKSM